MKKLYLLSIALLSITIANAQYNWSKTSFNSGGAAWALATCGNNIYVSAGAGSVYISNDTGATWNYHLAGPSGYDVPSISVSDATYYIFAGTSGPGVYLSTNNGSTWATSNNGITSGYIFSLFATGIYAYAGTSDGIFLTTNSGSSWSHVFSSIETWSITRSGGNIFAGTAGHGVYLSTSLNGSTYTAVNTGLPTNAVVSALAVSGGNIFAGTGSNSGGNSGVYLSTNNGGNWSSVSSGLPVGSGSQVKALAINGSNIFAGTNGKGVYLSQNNGASWTESPIPLNIQKPINH